MSALRWRAVSSLSMVEFSLISSGLQPVLGQTDRGGADRTAYLRRTTGRNRPPADHLWRNVASLYTNLSD